MRERQGYIYRRADATESELRDLLGAEAAGWAWTPAHMYTRSAQRDDDLLRGEQGCALCAGREIRWRRTGGPPDAPVYDVLVLALAAQPPEALPGFTPLPPDGAPWQIADTQVYLQHPLDKPKEDHDELRSAIRFVAPDGSTQFVALIDATSE